MNSDINNSIDKVTYTKGNEYYYSFEFKPNTKFKMKGNKNCISIKEIKQIDRIIAEIQPSIIYPHMELDMNYSYLPHSVNTNSSIVETDSTVWIHPPRQYFFKILELNPFPYIKKNKTIGESWNWDLTIGEQYADERWAEWKGNIINHCKYQYQGDSLLETNLGLLDCQVTVAEAQNIIGQSKLVSYFNSNLGFVKLHYTNIDGSEIILTLESFNVKRTRPLVREN